MKKLIRCNSLTLAAVLGLAALSIAPAHAALRTFTLQVQSATWTIRTGVDVTGLFLSSGPGTAHSLPGPELRVDAGDEVQITFINADSVPHALTFPGQTVAGAGVAVAAGGNTVYQWIPTAGTHYYAGETATATDRGMYGAVVVRSPQEPLVQRDNVMFFDEYPRTAAAVGHANPTYRTHEFIINGKALDAGVAGLNLERSQATVAMGERLLARVISIGVKTHAIHLHGHLFDAVNGRTPLAVTTPTDVMRMPSGDVRHLYVTPRDMGDWMFHCHVETHIVNQDGEYPGGMFTHLTVE